MELVMTMQLTHNIAFTIFATQTNNALSKGIGVTRSPHGELSQSQISKKRIHVNTDFWTV